MRASNGVWPLLLSPQFLFFHQRSPHKIESPEAFVRSIYSRYQSKMPDYNGKDAEAVFSPSLLQLIRKNGTSGFIGHLDVDPVCSCNEIDGLTVDHIAVSRLTKDQAVATVSLSFGNAGSQTLRLTLFSANGNWRVVT